MIEREFLISSLRCAKLRVALLSNEIDTIGVALKHRLMSPDEAIAAIDDLEAWPFLAPQIEGTSSQ